MKIFLYGRDRSGWAMDAEWKYARTFLIDIGHTLTSNFLIADIVHSVWWSPLLSYKFYPLRWKKIIAFATNEIDTNGPLFAKAKRFVDLWVAPSQAMCNKLRLAAVNVKYQPFYTDESEFTKLPQSKEAIAQDLGIDYEHIRDKLVIGSFQRDTLGEDLSQPRWQKNPELLVNILNNLPKEKFVLLLAGPRRHWIINQCKQRQIPYVYFGKEPQVLEDDIWQNTIDLPTVNKLYNISDIYLVSSKSEGGPKAVLESAFSRTMILSTAVGLVPDFLNEWCIYSTANEALERINEIIKGKDLSEIIESNYEKAYNRASYKPMRDRWKEIYDYFKSVHFT